MSGALAALVFSSTVAWSSTVASTSTTAFAEPAEISTPLRKALGEAPLSLTADRLTAELDTRTLIAEGNVILVRGGVVLRADRVRFARDADTVEANGNVTVIDDKSVLFCTEVTMKLPELAADLKDAELRIKDGIPPALRESLDAAGLRRYGKNELILAAETFQRTGPRSFEVEGGMITTCDCTEGQAPTWSISASSASVDLDSGATLLFPVFYAKGIPFFALPAFYVPLGPRRTGLLLPRFQTSAITTFSIYEPLFIALGESYDATIEPGFLWSRGPSAGAEFRWAPSRSTHGEVRSTFTFDFGEPTAEGTYQRTREDFIPRYAISGKHETRWDRGALVAELNLLGDPAYTEFSDRYLQRKAEYSQSRITVTATAENRVRTSGGLGLLQDLRGQSYPGLPGREVALFSGDLSGPGNIRYRLAELRLDAPMSPIGSDRGLVFGDARLAVHVYSAPRPEVERFLRADLRPRLLAPLHLGGVATLEPSAMLRLSGWTGREDRLSNHASRIAAITGARLSTELHRNFGDVAHSIRPELAYVLVPFVERGGDPAFDTFDEIDRLEPVQQLMARVATDLHDAKTGRRLAGLDLRAGRDLDFRDQTGAGWTELIARADLQLAADPIRVYADARAAVHPEDGTLTELIAGLTLGTSRGDSLTVTYGDFADRPPQYSLAAFEELVPASAADPLALDRWSSFRGLSTSVRTGLDLWEGWGRLSLAFDASFVFENDAVRPATVYGPENLRDTRTSLSWASSCECFGIGATVATDRTRPGFELVTVLLDLGQLGAVRTE